jgi:hypothetical protein
VRHNEGFRIADGITMATVLFRDKDRREIDDRLVRSFQSGRANFLIGSGASRPAIRTAGNIEAAIDHLFQSNDTEEANKKIYELLIDIQLPTNSLITGAPLLRLPSESHANYHQ